MGKNREMVGSTEFEKSFLDIFHRLQQVEDSQ